MQRSTWVVAGLFLVLISGCGTSDTVPDPSGSTVPADAGVGIEGVAGGAEGDAAAPVDEPPPLGVLRASDPAAVALGAGTPQLVEFFAFW